MKKLILILLLLPALAWGGEPIEIARMNPYILGSGVSAAAESCDTVNIVQSNTASLSDYDGFGSAASSVNYGSKFVASKDYDICSVKIIMRKVDGAGTEPGDATLYIYSDDGGSPSKPNAQVGTGTASVVWANLQTSCTEETFTLSTPVALTNGTAYWFVFKVASAGSATDYYSMCNSEPGGGLRTVDGYDTTWNAANANGQVRHKTYEYH